MSKDAKVVASADDGAPLIAYVVYPPGCLAQAFAALRRWLVRLIMVGLAFACGYGCKAAGG